MQPAGGERARRPGWEALRDLGLAVRWTTLAEGLRLSSRARVLVTTGDVAVWADACVEAVPAQPDTVYDLLAIAPGNGNDPDTLAAVEPALAELAGAEHADPAVEARKWRLAELVALIDRVAAWPLDPGEHDDGRACAMWSACRDLWAAWTDLDRPALFYSDGREVACYHGRPFDDVIAEYRVWIADERARLAAADAAQPAA